jgi:PAS domain S-box-containing protein
MLTTQELKSRLSFLILGQRGGQNRVQIINALKERPYNLNQLAELMDVNYRTIKHHTDMLQKHEIITASHTGGYGQVFFLSPDLEKNIPLFDEIVNKLQSVTTSPKFFQNVLEQTTDAIAIVDKKLEVFFWNESAVMLFGKKKEEVLGKPLDVFKDTAELKHAITHIEEGKHMVYFTAEAVDTTGKTLTLEVVVDGIKDDDNKLVGFSVLTTDITEKRQSEEKMAYQASLLGRVNDAVIATDAQMKITFWNKAAEDIYGYKASEVLGRSTHEILDAKYPGKTYKQLIALINKTGHFKGEITQRHKEGWRIPILANITVLKDDTGKSTGYLTVNSDLTEEKKAKQVIDKMASFPAINPNPVFEFDQNNKITFSNAALTKITQDLGVGLKALFPPDPQDLIKRLKARPGKPIYVEVQVKDTIFGESVHLAPEGDRLRIYAWDITDQKKTQEALKISEARLRLAVETINAAEWELDLKDGTVQRSFQHDRIFGYKKMLPKWTYDMFLEHVIPDDKKLVEDTFKKIKRGTPAWNLECRIRGVDGGVRWIWICGRPKPTEGEGPEHLIGITLDITEEKMAQEALRESVERFTVIAKSTPDHLLVQDKDLRYIMVVNPQLGLTEKDMLGKTDYDFLAKDDADKITKTKTQVMRSGTPIKMDTSLLSRSGSVEYFSGTYVPKYNAKGEIDGIIGYFRNVTERRRNMEELRKLKEELEVRVAERTAELAQANKLLVKEILEHKQANAAVEFEHQRFNDVLETLPAYVILLTPDYHVPFMNRTFKERFGESHGKKCYEFLFNKTAPCDDCKTYDALKNMAPIEWEWTGPDGRNYYIYDFPFRDTDGSQMILEMGVDITELKSTQLELKKQKELLEKMMKQQCPAIAEQHEKEKQ